MESRPVMLAVAFFSFLFVGYAMVTSLLRSDDSPLSRAAESSHSAPHPDIYDALHDLAYFAVFGGPDSKPVSDTAYVTEGMMRLATALEMLARRDGIDSSHAPTDLQGAAGELRTAVAVQNPVIMRTALVRAAAATTELQQWHYPHLSAATARLEGATARIQPDRNLADQREAFAAYFDAISDALMPMILPRH